MNPSRQPWCLLIHSLQLCTPSLPLLIFLGINCILKSARSGRVKKGDEANIIINTSEKPRVEG